MTFLVCPRISNHIHLRWSPVIPSLITTVIGFSVYGQSASTILGQMANPLAVTAPSLACVLPLILLVLIVLEDLVLYFLSADFSIGMGPFILSIVVILQ
ncbi:hypothetical protein Tco_1068813 [Tanacetum coccineum]|uniref:Uncharacterized protein n=1 Tax=Tanacetum coccineum TaxID=301880 RepID=A0ABQ5HGZ5_9ASTR